MTTGKDADLRSKPYVMVINAGGDLVVAANPDRIDRHHRRAERYRGDP